MKRFALGVLVLLLVGMSCSEEPGAGSGASGGGSGSAAAHSVVLNVRPDSTDETESIPLEVTGVDCGDEWTRAELGDDFVSVRHNPMFSDEPVLDITVSLEILDVPGGYRDTVMAEDTDFSKADDGSVSGTYEFRLYGDDPTDYELELNINCG